MKKNAPPYLINAFLYKPDKQGAIINYVIEKTQNYILMSHSTAAIAQSHQAAVVKWDIAMYYNVIPPVRKTAPINIVFPVLVLSPWCR